MKKTTLGFLITLLFAGCAEKYAEISKPDLERAFILNSSPTFEGYFYQGSIGDKMIYEAP